MLSELDIHLPPAKALRGDARRNAFARELGISSYRIGGVRYEGKQSVASNPPAYHKGEKLTVVYNPAHPYESDVDSGFDLYFKSLGFGFVGVILFLIGFSAMGGRARLKELAFSRGRA